MDNLNQDQMKTVFETAKTLLEVSYALRDADLLPEIGKEVTKLADQTLKVLEDQKTEIVEEPFVKVDVVHTDECAMPEMPVQDGMCAPGECQCCDDERMKCHGHSDMPASDTDPETMCNGHNAMGPSGGMDQPENVAAFPSGNSSPEIDNEINALLTKVKGQIDGK